MSLTVKQVTTKAEMKQFIYLPEKIHAHHKGWVPPFYSDDARNFDPARNLAHKYCESIYALAWEDGKPVGRIAGIINHRYNTHAGIRIARFGFPEVPERIDVLAALLHFVEGWATGKGMEKLVGPQGFTEEDPEGFIIEGFGEIANLATIQNFPSIPAFMEQLSYVKEVDYVVYKIDIRTALNEDYHKLYKWVKRNKDLQLKEFRTKKELWKYIVPVFQLMNESFMTLYGYSPFSDEEIVAFVKRYMPGVDPRFIKCVVNGKEEVVSFIIGIPNMSPGIIKAKGRIFPFGFIHILHARNTSRKLDLYMGAVKEEYRSKGLDVLMGYRILEEAHAAGIEYIDTHHELETNTAVRAEMERGGGKIYKRYRIYQKALG
jgi:GNAT superfamily N-acetyltransferase